MPYVLIDETGRFLYLSPHQVYACDHQEAASTFHSLEQLNHLMALHALNPGRYHIGQFHSDLIGNHPADLFLVPDEDALGPLIDRAVNGSPMSERELERILVIKQKTDDMIVGSLFYACPDQELLFIASSPGSWAVKADVFIL